MSKIEEKCSIPKSRYRRITFEVIVMVLIAVLVAIAVLAESAIIVVPEILIHKHKDAESLMLELFSVQASVSTLGIALVSIITGLTDETVFGISLSRYITRIKPVFLKHNRLIVADLVAVVLNYIAIAFMWFNISVVLFVISIIITILLAQEVFVIFYGKDALKEDVRQYVLTNYSEVALTEVNQELSNAIETGNTLTIKQIYALIEEILKAEVKKERYCATKITAQIIRMAADSFEQISYKHNAMKSNEHLKFICNLYEIADENEEAPLDFPIWDEIYISFFRALKDLQFEQLRDDHLHLKLHDLIYKNRVKDSAQNIMRSDLSRFTGWVYTSLFSESNKFSEAEASRLKEDIFNHSYYFLLTSHNLSDELETVAMIELCKLNKAAIDIGDVDGLTRNITSHFRYPADNTKCDVAFLISIIYLYYLSERESLVDQKTLQTTTREILQRNQHIIASFLMEEIDLSKVISLYSEHIHSILKGWEYMEIGEVKCMVIDGVVTDFLVFSSLHRYWDRSTLMTIVKVLVPDSTFSIYSRYFPDSDFKLLRKWYTEFVSIFYPHASEELALEELYMLKDVLDEQYKKETLANGAENAITAEQLEELSVAVKAEIDSTINSFSCLHSLGIEDSIENLIEEPVIISIIDIPNFVLRDRNYMRLLRGHLQAGIFGRFFNAFEGNVLVEEIGYREKDKQERLVEMCKKYSIDADTVLGDRETFWEEDDSDLLHTYTEKMTRVKFPNGISDHYLIDSRQVKFLLYDVSIDFEDIGWGDIEKKCRKTEDGRYEYNVTNDLYIPFEAEELRELYANTHKRMVVRGSVRYQKCSQKIGVGIHIIRK